MNSTPLQHSLVKPSKWLSVAAIAVASSTVLLYSTQKANADEKKKSDKEKTEKTEKKSEKKSEKNKSPLDKKDPTAFTLISKTQVSPNTSIYRFALPDDGTLELPVASCIVAQADLGEDKLTKRPYTPITYDTKGYFELMIKSYPTGKLSKKIGELKVGDQLSFTGPFDKIEYTPNMKKTIGMIAGGTGITPMLQVIHKILSNPEDKTEIRLIFANVTKEDILLKDRIDGWTKAHPNFKVYYTLDKPPAQGWKEGKGFVSAEMVKKFIPAPSNETLVMVCGPDAMVKMVAGAKTPDYKQGELAGVLKDLGYNETNVFKF